MGLPQRSLVSRIRKEIVIILPSGIGDLTLRRVRRQITCTKDEDRSDL
jgi:hypothetical protein